MTEHVPSWWEFTLLALAAFRLTRLIGWDSVTEPLRRKVTGLGDWEAGPLPASYRESWDKWLHCPWCQGAWTSGAVAVAWWIVPDWTLLVATVLAISSFVGLVAKNLDP